MIKLIVGTKGSGKTKAMIDQINDAVKTSKGNVVVVEKGMKLTYDIAPAARLIAYTVYKHLSCFDVHNCKINIRICTATVGH